MKFTVAEMLAKLPLPANEKWKEGVWDVEPFRKGNASLVFFRLFYQIICNSTEPFSQFYRFQK